MLEFILWAVAIAGGLGCIAYFFQSIDTEKKTDLISGHLEELAAARAELVSEARFGLIDTRKWDRVKRNFIYGHFGLSGRKEHSLAVQIWMKKLDQLIDDHIAQYRHPVQQGQPQRDKSAGNSTSSSTAGTVYMLRNEAMPGLLKIGMTARDVESRLRELNAPTGVPAPFEIVYQIKVSDCSAAEQFVHEMLAEHRTNKGREFFKVDSTTAINAMLSAQRRYPD